MFTVPHRPASFLFALPLLAALAACGPSAPDRTEPATIEGTDAAEVATDWTAENPTDPAVPVQLPTTRLTNEPVAAPSAR